MLRLLTVTFLTLVFAMPAFSSEVEKKADVKVPTTVKVDWKKQLPPKNNVPAYLQEISVTIKSHGGEGSGVVKTRTMQIDGKNVKVNFIWTAAHVVENLREVKEVIDPRSGTKREVVQFRNAEIVKELVENGRRVGELKMDAEVVKYSRDQDLALLRICKRDFVQSSATFYLDEVIPSIGTDLYHVGSLLGQMGSNSMTSGIVSQIGRIIDKREFDQSTATAFPGSSGGGLFLKNENSGAYMGMIVRGAGEGFNLFVPIRRIRSWAKQTKIEWALDDNVAMPTELQLQKLPVEDIGVDFAVGATSTPAGGSPTPAPAHGPTVSRKLLEALFPTTKPRTLQDIPTLPQK